VDIPTGAVRGNQEKRKGKGNIDYGFYLFYAKEKKKGKKKEGENRAPS